MLSAVANADSTFVIYLDYLSLMYLWLVQCWVNSDGINVGAISASHVLEYRNCAICKLHLRHPNPSKLGKQSTILELTIPQHFLNRKKCYGKSNLSLNLYNIVYIFQME